MVGPARFRLLGLQSTVRHKMVSRLRILDAKVVCPHGTVDRRETGGFGRGAQQTGGVPAVRHSLGLYLSTEFHGAFLPFRQALIHNSSGSGDTLPTSRFWGCFRTCACTRTGSTTLAGPATWTPVLLSFIVGDSLLTRWQHAGYEQGSPATTETCCNSL